MGFPKDKAEYALKMNKNNIEQAMEWLLAHAEEDIPTSTEQSTPAAVSGQPMDVDETSSPMTEKKDEAAAGAAEGSATEEQPKGEAKSIKCEDCGKLFQSSVEVEFHATKSGHSNFAESTEEKKPLTEEEKKAQLALIEEKLNRKRLEKEEQEKQDALEREKNRIRSGKDMAEARRKMEEEEMKKIVEQRKREKAEDQRARDRVKAQIEADKAARRERESGVKPVNVVSPLPQPAAQPSVAATPPKDYKQTRVQIRMPDGTTMTETFDKNEQLAAVRLFVQLKTGDEAGVIPLRMLTTFPRKVFVDDDFDQTLEKLGLVPSATIMVTRGG